MKPGPIKDIVIVGGGTAGWMTAAALSKVLSPAWTITLIESEEIGTVGVGEATIPLINIYNRALELDEDDFMRRTHATFKLGIEFVNWGRQGDSYIHGFGPLGPDIGVTKFYQFWLKAAAQGRAAPIESYSINTAACRANKFLRARSDMGNSPMGEIAHAYHFDASLYALYLRGMAEKERVERANKYLKAVGLADFADRYPKDLSGGMKQRVALARTLINQPRLVLMDEPFGALDPQTRWGMQGLLLDIARTEDNTTIFITHDVSEAVYLADTVYVLSSRPARILHRINVPQFANREITVKSSAEFRAVERQLLDLLYAPS